jgi:anti-repressor protein
MNELIKIENGEVKLDSRMIAEHFEKAHSDVLKDIRDEIGKLEKGGFSNEGIFSLVEYVDKKGEKRPAYEMTEEGALQLAARYDAVARRKLIIKIKELKEQGSMRLPRTYAEALRELADKAEENERLTQENRLMLPKAEFFDQVADSKDAIDLGTAAKVLNMGIGRNRLFEVLRDKHILMNDNKPYQTYIDRGYFRTVEQKYTKPDGSTCISIKTLVYQKGLNYIRNILKTA